jgi:hypothetical protein
MTKGTKLKVEVKPEEKSLLAVARPEPPITYEVSVLPRSRWSPGVGLSLLVSPQSTFPEYSTRASETSDSVSVVESGEFNNTVDWAVTLGLTYRLGDESKWALVVPQVSVNPSDKIRSFALGGGISWRWMTVGLGVMWTKHEELDGQEVGESLRFKEDLRTVETYGGGQFYVSIALTAIPGIKP